jgi:hypothetical protein
MDGLPGAAKLSFLSEELTPLRSFSRKQWESSVDKLLEGQVWNSSH